MPFLRQLRKITPTGRITIKLSPAQRDQLLIRPGMPRRLGYMLHRAPVTRGKLQIRITSVELDALILSAVAAPAANPVAKGALDVFLSYLEAQSDRFETELQS